MSAIDRSVCKEDRSDYVRRPNPDQALAKLTAIMISLILTAPASEVEKSCEYILNKKQIKLEPQNKQTKKVAKVSERRFPNTRVKNQISSKVHQPMARANNKK